MYNQPQISEIIFPENSPKSTILKHILQSSSEDFSYEAGNEFPAELPNSSATQPNSKHQTTMSTSKPKNSDTNNQSGKRIVYSEFGNIDNSAALQRGIQEIPPNQQNLKIEASRKGRGGKTVTVISGFQGKPETLAALTKQLKAQCGTGGTVKENEIEIQGEHKQKLLEIITKLGYKAKISGG